MSSKAVERSHFVFRESTQIHEKHTQASYHIGTKSKKEL